MLKALLLSAAFVGASVIGAAGQSSTSPAASGSANVSAATHCKDKTTGQARLKTAANTGSATSGITTGAARGTPSSGAAGSSGSMGGSANPAGASGSTSAAANLPDCP